MNFFKKATKYIVTTVIGLLFVLLVCFVKDFNFDMERQRIIRIFCDGTFLAAVILIGFGLLVSISNFGLFTAVSYSFKRFFVVFSKDYKEKKKDMPDYHEYRAVKLEHDVSGGFIYIPGVVYLVISIILLVLYNGA